MIERCARQTTLWLPNGDGTAHTDPAAWGQYASRINLAAGVGVSIAAICGWCRRPRTGNPAPQLALS